MTERNIAATPQRKQQARQEGRFPRSHALTLAVLALATMGAVFQRAPDWLQEGQQFLRIHLSQSPTLTLGPDAQQTYVAEPLGRLTATIAPWLITSFLAVIGLQLTQGGFVWRPQRIAPKTSRLGPGNLGRTISGDSAIRSLLALVKSVAGIVVLVAGVWWKREDFVPTPSTHLMASLMRVSTPMVQITIAVILTVLLFSALEYGIQVWAYYGSLKMSRQEMREEARGRNAINIRASTSANEKPKH